MTAHYVNKGRPSLGYYEVFTGEEGSFWQWTETAKGETYRDRGQWYPTVTEAYRDAANDWEQNGNSANKRLAGQLRAAATRAKKQS